MLVHTKPRARPRHMGDYCVQDVATAGRVCYAGDPPNPYAQPAPAYIPPPQQNYGWWWRNRLPAASETAASGTVISMDRPIRPTRPVEIIPPSTVTPGTTPATVTQNVATATTSVQNAIQSVQDFLAGSTIIQGVPNWAVALGGGALLLFFSRRR